MTRVAILKDELRHVTLRLRAVQKRLRRQACPSGLLEQVLKGGAGSDVPKPMMLKVPAHASGVMAVFELTGRNATVAARFLAMRNKLHFAEGALPNSLVAAIEDAYLHVPFETLVRLLDSPPCPSQRRELFMAGSFLVKKRLRDWLLAQNKKGVAPGRRQLVSEACQGIPKDLPRVIVDMLFRYFQGGGRPSCQRKWLRRFRKEFGLRLGRLRVQSVMPVEEMQRKAGAGWKETKQTGCNF